MKKSILLFAIVSLAFVSCKKEDVAPEPTPLTTNLTSVTVSFAKENFPSDGTVNIPSMSFSAPFTTACAGINPYSVTFTVGIVYVIRYTINSVIVFEGEVSFNSAGDLVVNTPNTVPGSTATLELKMCQTLGWQLVVKS